MRRFIIAVLLSFLTLPASAGVIKFGAKVVAHPPASAAQGLKGVGKGLWKAAKAASPGNAAKVIKKVIW